MTAQAPIPDASDWSPFVPVQDAEDDANDWRDELGAAEGDVLRALYVTWTETDGGHTATLHRLIGVTAENADERLFLDRETVIARVGERDVNLAEDNMDEDANQ